MVLGYTTLQNSYQRRTNAFTPAKTWGLCCALLCRNEMGLLGPLVENVYPWEEASTSSLKVTGHCPSALSLRKEEEAAKPHGNAQAGKESLASVSAKKFVNCVCRRTRL